MIELPAPKKITWTPRVIPFLLVHVACFAAFFVPFAWTWVAVAVGLYLLRMWALTAGYHRYFSHRSFKTSRAFQFVLAFLGGMCVQKGALWWAAHHRRHHRNSDRHDDLHSPLQHGFLWAHVGWVLTTDHDDTDFDRIADFARYPELRWLNRWHWTPGVLLAAVLLAVGGLPAFIWGFCISTVAVWHATFCINSLTHMWGKRRYATVDDSRNSLLLALLTLGEGWHNNHHYYKASTRQGFFWWEVDLTYYVLRGLAALGIVWDLKEPSEKVRAGEIPAPGAAALGQDSGPALVDAARPAEAGKRAA